MPHFSAATIILLIIAALLLFGPNRLPELGRAFGRTLKEFKSGAKDIMGDDESQTPVQTRKTQEIESKVISDKTTDIES